MIRVFLLTDGSVAYKLGFACEQVDCLALNTYVCQIMCACVREILLQV